jgi:hypothetical protein
MLANLNSHSDSTYFESIIIPCDGLHFSHDTVNYVRLFVSYVKQNKRRSASSYKQYAKVIKYYLLKVVVALLELNLLLIHFKILAASCDLHACCFMRSPCLVLRAISTLAASCDLHAWCFMRFPRLVLHAISKLAASCDLHTCCFM